MALIKRKELQDLLEKEKIAPGSRIFLFFGERYLCNQAADQLQEFFLQKNSATVHAIDGEVEDFGQTLARLMSFSLLPGLQVYRVSDSRIFHTKTVLSTIWDKAVQAYESKKFTAAGRSLQAFIQAAYRDNDDTTSLSEIPRSQWKAQFGFEKPSGSLHWADQLLGQFAATAPAASPTNLADRCIEAFNKGLPAQNILILTAESVDKRQRLFTCLKKKGTVIDCTVTTGAGAAAQKEQKEILREMMLNTLKKFDKKIDSGAVDMFFERVGFHPVAVVVETEKLALYTAERAVISCDDLQAMVGRSREDALFELTDAFSKRQMARTLMLLASLQEQGIHGLAILATMRNFINKLLLVKFLQMQTTPKWRNDMKANEFQNTYLPKLRNSGEWSELLKGHPYALFMSFSKASEYNVKGLKSWLELLLQAEFRLKGSPLPASLVLEDLFLTMLSVSE